MSGAPAEAPCHREAIGPLLLRLARIALIGT
jgi:hypothetical protein